LAQLSAKIWQISNYKNARNLLIAKLKRALQRNNKMRTKKKTG
jgi:hypothetical protein